MHPHLTPLVDMPQDTAVVHPEDSLEDPLEDTVVDPREHSLVDKVSNVYFRVNHYAMS